MQVNRRSFLKGLGEAGFFFWLLKSLKLLGFTAKPAEEKGESRLDMPQRFPSEVSYFPKGMYGENSLGPPGETWNELIYEV